MALTDCSVRPLSAHLWLPLGKANISVRILYLRYLSITKPSEDSTN